MSEMKIKPSFKQNLPEIYVPFFYPNFVLCNAFFFFFLIVSDILSTFKTVKKGFKQLLNITEINTLQFQD